MGEADEGERFGDFLLRLRREAGLTQQEVAYKMGPRPDGEGAGRRYADSTVAKWEQNRNRPQDYDTVVRLAEALGLPKFSARRARLFWLAGKWLERAERLEGVPAARCRKLWGRTELLDEVLAELRAPDPPWRVALLAAFGGYGKTEFARYVAATLARSGDCVEVAWVSLKREEFQYTPGAGGATSPPCAPDRAAVVEALLHRLACRTEGELRGRLAGEPLLVVLDNLETLPPGEREAALGDLHRLLGAGPSRALATSRFDVAAPFLYRPRFAGLSRAASADLLRDEAHHAPRPSELQAATPETLRQIWELTRGMPLALHLVVGQCQHHALPRVLDDLAAARGPDDDDALCRHLFFQAWRELGRPARVLLAYLGAATRAPQLPGQLLGLAPADDLRFDERTLDAALGELARWFLLERAEGWEPDQEPTYEMHPLTRAFVLSDEIRARWEREVVAADLHEAALRQHREILRRGLGEPGQW